MQPGQFERETSQAQPFIGLRDQCPYTTRRIIRTAVFPITEQQCYELAAGVRSAENQRSGHGELLRTELASHDTIADGPRPPVDLVAAVTDHVGLSSECRGTTENFGLGFISTATGGPTYGIRVIHSTASHGTQD